MVRLRKANGREEPWKVPYWGIGNEAWGCGGNLSAEAYVELARRYATFCREHDGNKLYRIAAGASDDDLAWTEALMKAISTLGGEPRNIFQAVSVHYYTVPGTWEHKGSATEFDVDDYYRTMLKAQDIDRVLTGHSTVLDAYDPKRKIGLVLDEWGTWWDVEPGTNPGFLYQQNALRDALVASLHFDVFHRHAERLVMANIAQTVNVLQAMLLTDDSGGLVLTPTYHVFEMNKGHHDATSVPVHLVDRPAPYALEGKELELLSASASVKDDRALVSVTNLDPGAPADVVLDLRGATIRGHRGRLLTAPQLQAHNSAGDPQAVVPVPLTDLTVDSRGLRLTLPPHSFATVELDL
jgi:alpha-N-arabinofuranosidase